MNARTSFAVACGMCIAFAGVIGGCGTRSNDQVAIDVDGLVPGSGVRVGSHDPSTTGVLFNTNGHFQSTGDAVDPAGNGLAILAQPLGEACRVQALHPVSQDPAAASAYRVSCRMTASIVGHVVGLRDDSRMLITDGRTLLTIRADGGFAFDGLRPPGRAYDVAVLTQPDRQTCDVDNGYGEIAQGVAADVKITCR